ncbi:MAG TPA: four helix bundle protein [Candidatus Angelobacter sp.]|nr:four helix bundle protein [Candidatus Angelobacter sp.]
MTYQRFEDLPVWEEAARLYELADDFLENAPPRMRHSFRNQFERAVLSVSNNIAEGFERGTTNELLQFIYISRGSAGEVRSMLGLLLRRPWAEHLKSEISNLKSVAESCARQLRGWADSLQNSQIKGQRHLNNKIRAEDEQKKKATALQKKLLANLPINHPLRRKENQAEESEI